MAIFNITVNNTIFNVETTSIVSTSCSTVVEYTITAENTDQIDITLSGNYTNEFYISNGVQESFNNSTSVVFNNSLKVVYAVENGGSAGVFNTCNITITNNSTSNNISSYSFSTTREDDSPICVNESAATYDELYDTPGTKVGSAGKFVRVSDDEQTHEYVDVIGSDKHFEFEETTPNTIWTLNHNLQKFPSVTIVSSSGDEVEGDINHVDDDNLVITFSAPFSGKAYLN